MGCKCSSVATDNDLDIPPPLNGNSPAIYFRTNGPLSNLDPTFDPFEMACHPVPTKDDDDDDPLVAVKRVLCKRFGLSTSSATENAENAPAPPMLLRQSLSGVSHTQTEMVVLYVLSVRTAPVRSKHRYKRRRPKSNERDAEYHDMQFAWKERQPNETTVRVQGSGGGGAYIGSGILNHDQEITPCCFLWDTLVAMGEHDEGDMLDSIAPQKKQQKNKDQQQLRGQALPNAAACTLNIDITIEPQQEEEEEEEDRFRGRAVVPLAAIFDVETRSRQALPVVDQWIPIHATEATAQENGGGGESGGRSGGRLVGAVRVMVGRVLVSSREASTLLKENDKRR